MRKLLPLYILFIGLSAVVITGCKSSTSDSTEEENNNNVQEIEICQVLVDDLSLPFGSQYESFALGRTLASGGSIYWYDFDSSQGDNGGAIKKVSDSGGTVTVLAGGLGGVNDFEVDETHLYWIEYDIEGGSGQVKKVELDTGEITILAEGNPEQEDGESSPYDVFFPTGLTLDGTDVCWGEEVGGSAIRCVPKAGGGVRDLARGENFKPMSLNSDADFFYVLDANSSGQILRISKADGSLDILAGGFASTQGLQSLILDDGMLYWVELIEDGPVFKLPVEGGSVSTLDDGLFIPRVVIADDTHIYYSTVNGVFKMSKTGSSRISAATCSNVTSGSLFALDESSIYVTDTGNSESGEGKIVKTEKDNGGS